MSREPLFLIPRMLPRHWGREDLGSWCAGAARPDGRIGEIWSCDSANRGKDEDHLGALIKSHPQEVLGDLGRAPPSIRLVLAAQKTHPFATRLSFWRVTEAEAGVRAIARDTHERVRHVRCQSEDLLRAEDCSVRFEGPITALEVRPNFLGSNLPGSSCAIRRLPTTRVRSARQTWLRDTALSAEVWTLPESSVVKPDGETCHVLTALSDGAVIDGKAIARGESVLIPACGRSVPLAGAGAQLLVSYPDLVPTSVWQHVPEPDPGASALLPLSRPPYWRDVSPPGSLAA